MRERHELDRGLELVLTSGSTQPHGRPAGRLLYLFSFSSLWRPVLSRLRFNPDTVRGSNVTGKLFCLREQHTITEPVPSRLSAPKHSAPIPSAPSRAAHTHSCGCRE